jgi:DNA (cytosine-5)-methyltransferase 1
VQVVDFFSGCGGTSEGFRQLGLEIALGLDCDPTAAETFRSNFPSAAFIERDITQVGLDEVSQFIHADKVLFSGCAPCQPFSRQNQQRTSKDPRWGLLGEFERFVLGLRPDYVVLENVPGLQRVGRRGPLPGFLSALKDAGYDCASGLVRASDMGVPQTRLRLVVVAALKGKARLPEPVSSEVPTVREAIAHLPALEAGGADPDDPDHAAMRLSPLNLRRIRATPQGGSRRDWPEALRLDCHKDHDGHSDVYGRMAWDAPASGLTTRCLSYSNGRFGHPEQDRAISAREAALLQSFPASFRFSGQLTGKGRQIGNAVPPVMAHRLADVLIGS